MVYVPSLQIRQLWSVIKDFPPIEPHLTEEDALCLLILVLKCMEADVVRGQPYNLCADFLKDNVLPTDRKIRGELHRPGPPRGQAKGAPKITPEILAEMNMLHNKGMSPQEIARGYGLSGTAVRRRLNRGF